MNTTEKLMLAIATLTPKEQEQVASLLAKAKRNLASDITSRNERIANVQALMDKYKG